MKKGFYFYDIFVSFQIYFAELNPMSVANHLLQSLNNVISESLMTCKQIFMYLLKAPKDRLKSYNFVAKCTSNVEL
jgi:hypothetical protein